MSIKKSIEKKRGKPIFIYTFFLYYFLFFIFCEKSFSQDSIAAPVDLTEEKELKFQKFFFKALSEKSLGNYQKALQNLESCNQILANDITVFFEFSKNYLNLNNTLLAKEYIDRAIEKDTSNIWLLKHLVKVYEKNNNYSEAIKVQQKIAHINLNEREHLVQLFLQNKEYKKANNLLTVLEKEKGLSANLKRIKNNLYNGRKKLIKEKKVTGTLSLIDTYNSNKSYKSLVLLLENVSEKPTELLKYSDEGIALFPAQPYVYLMKGKALNNQKKHEKALICLQNGIDFVIEDNMEIDFYKEMVKALKSLGRIKEEEKYMQKIKKIKN